MRGLSDEFGFELQKLLKVAKGWTQENKDRAVALGEEFADLMSEAASGAAVDEELEHVKAQVLSLAAEAEQTGVAIFNQALESALGIFSRVLRISP